eukprot:GHRR01005185.1.p1 GENE.GHRR01005185.1~~GHRR01005185.1.p1  ORF type:complete len:157 (+),score=18.27 GHRR01005185.1:292-762(+)
MPCSSLLGALSSSANGRVRGPTCSRHTALSMQICQRAPIKARSSAQPAVTVVFNTPDSSQPISIECPSGDQLRYSMLENKVDLYTTWGKIWSCGGAGQCGTCIVQVVQGADLLSERTATEDKKLKNKPGSWRLACQTIVGDGTTTGKVVIRTKPQA